MARILIKDLDENHKMDNKTMRKIYGGADSDRYQNMDVNYLLTRTEYYLPLVTLTSNLDVQKE